MISIEYKKIVVLTETLLFCVVFEGCHRTALGLRGMSGLGTSMSKSEMSHMEEKKKLVKVIDSHVYFENVNDEMAVQPSSGMEVEFKGANVVGAIVHFSHLKFYPKVDSKDDFRLAICAPMNYSGHEKKLRKEFENKKFRCGTIDRAYLRQALTSSLYLPYFQLANEFNVPLVVTFGSYSSRTDQEELTDPQLPMLFKEKVLAFPKVNFVITHLGSPFLSEALEMVRKYPNVYVDTSVPSGKDISLMTWTERNEQVIENLIPFLAFPNKVLFASSWPKSRIPPYVEAIENVVPEAHWSSIFHDNALRVFKL